MATDVATISLVIGDRKMGYGFSDEREAAREFVECLNELDFEGASYQISVEFYSDKMVTESGSGVALINREREKLEAELEYERLSAPQPSPNSTFSQWFGCHGGE